MRKSLAWLRCSLRGFCTQNKEGDHILRCSSLEEDIEVFSIKADDLVRDAQRRHNATPAATVVLGNALMGTLLLNSVLPQVQTVKMQIKGDGPFRYVHAISERCSLWRGYIHNAIWAPECKIQPASLLGKSEMHLKTSELYKFSMGPYCEIAESLVYFLRQVEKVDTAAGFSVTFRDGIAKGARGFIVQVYPLADKLSCKELLSNIRQLPCLQDECWDSQHVAEHITSKLLKGIRSTECRVLTTPQIATTSGNNLPSEFSLSDLEQLQTLFQEDVVEVPSKDTTDVVEQAISECFCALDHSSGDDVSMYENGTFSSIGMSSQVCRIRLPPFAASECRKRPPSTPRPRARADSRMHH